MSSHSSVNSEGNDSMARARELFRFLGGQGLTASASSVGRGGGRGGGYRGSNYNPHHGQVHPYSSQLSVEAMDLVNHLVAANMAPPLVGTLRPFSVTLQPRPQRYPYI